MKTTPLLLASALAFAWSLVSARAAEPAPVTLTPEMRAMLIELLKAVQETPEAAPFPAPAPDASSAPTAAGREARPLGFASSLRTSSLTTGTLAAGGLAPSGSLGGRGTGGGRPRLNDQDWRLLFPLRHHR